MELSSIAIKLNGERHLALHCPKNYGFFHNKRGLLQKCISTKVYLRDKSKGIVLLGNGTLCYADQDPQADEPAAELVRSKRWKEEDVGNLWCLVNKVVITLAKVTPLGVQVLRGGFIEDGGEKRLIIDSK